MYIAPSDAGESETHNGRDQECSGNVKQFVVLYSNICIRKVIAETGTRVPVSVPIGYPVRFFYREVSIACYAEPSVRHTLALNENDAS